MRKHFPSSVSSFCFVFSTLFHMNVHIDIAKKAEAGKDEIESARNIPKDLIHRVKQAGLVKRWENKSVLGQLSPATQTTTAFADAGKRCGSTPVRTAGSPSTRGIQSDVQEETESWERYSDGHLKRKSRLCWGVANKM